MSQLLESKHVTVNRNPFRSARARWLLGFIPLYRKWHGGVWRGYWINEQATGAWYWGNAKPERSYGTPDLQVHQTKAVLYWVDAKGEANSLPVNRAVQLLASYLDHEL